MNKLPKLSKESINICQLAYLSLDVTIENNFWLRHTCMSLSILFKVWRWNKKRMYSQIWCFSWGILALKFHNELKIKIGFSKGIHRSPRNPFPSDSSWSDQCFLSMSRCSYNITKMLVKLELFLKWHSTTVV